MNELTASRFRVVIAGEDERRIVWDCEEDRPILVYDSHFSIEANEVCRDLNEAEREVGKGWRPFSDHEFQPGNERHCRTCGQQRPAH